MCHRRVLTGILRKFGHRSRPANPYPRPVQSKGDPALFIGLRSKEEPSSIPIFQYFRKNNSQGEIVDRKSRELKQLETLQIHEQSTKECYVREAKGLMCLAQCNLRAHAGKQQGDPNNPNNPNNPDLGCVRVISSCASQGEFARVRVGVVKGDEHRRCEQ
jgi:hypothetical protein